MGSWAYAGAVFTDTAKIPMGLKRRSLPPLVSELALEATADSGTAEQRSELLTRHWQQLDSQKLRARLHEVKVCGPKYTQ